MCLRERERGDRERKGGGRRERGREGAEREGGGGGREQGMFTSNMKEVKDGLEKVLICRWTSSDN